MKFKKIMQGLESKDERIVKETASIASKLFLLEGLLALALLMTKLTILDYTYTDCILEGLGLLAVITYYLIRTKTLGLPLTYSKDTHMKEIQERFLSHCFYGLNMIFVIGEFILLLLLGDSKIYTILWYLPVWMIPSLIFTGLVVKKGLFIYGSSKKKTKNLKSFKLRVFIGSLFFGIFTGYDFVFKDGTFHFSGIVWVFALGLMWGVPFYFVMKAMVNMSEKKADQNVKEL